MLVVYTFTFWPMAVVELDTVMFMIRAVMDVDNL